LQMLVWRERRGTGRPARANAHRLAAYAWQPVVRAMHG
jgi:hypothetical protein